MANKALNNISYPDLFAALGTFIAEKELQDVFVMEFEQGVIVSGTALLRDRAGAGFAPQTFVLSENDLRGMVSNKKAKSEKRGLFGL